MPQYDANFDETYHNQLQNTYLLQSLLKSDDICPITPKAMRNYVNSLKNQKAPDINGLSAEHLKLSSPVIIKVLCSLINNILSSGKFRSVTPILKKNKPAKNPNSYRRITITSIIGKVVEKHQFKISDQS